MENISAVIQEIIRVDRLVAQENQDAEDAAEKLLSDKTEELKKIKIEAIQTYKDRNREAYLSVMEEAKKISRDVLVDQKNKNDSIKDQYHRYKTAFAHQVMAELLKNERDEG